MRRLMLGLAACAATALGGGTATAQNFSRNAIIDSGNGAGNLIAAFNRGSPTGFGLFGGPAAGFQKNKIINSGNGVGNTILAGNLNGFGPGLVPGGFGPGLVPGGFGPGVGYPPVGYPPIGYPPVGCARPLGFGGVNVNVVTNSGNGAGNAILTGNLNNGFRPGGVNINVITNSGNGVGNLIGALNR